MSKKTQEKFRRADLTAQIEMAKPLARHALLTGLETFEDDHEELVMRVSELVGHDGPACSDSDVDKIEELAKGAFAFGIAVGLLLRPEAFKGGLR
jgi:hypothetical protein